MFQENDMAKEKISFTPTIIIPGHLVGEVQPKLAYVDERISAARILDDGSKIELILRKAVSPEQAAEIEAKVQRVVEEMTKGAIKSKVEVLEDYLDRSVLYAKDPMDELLALGEVSKEETGIYTLGPLVTRLISYFETKFLSLADHFEAKPYRFPTLMSAKMLDRVDYFSAFPHSLTFASHLREDLDVINNFAKTAAYEEDGLKVPSESFSRIQTLLSPAVCYHLYFSLADHPLPDGKLIATAVGNCFRYESTNLTSLERMWNFTMWEVIFVGSKDFILENREKSREFMHDIFEEIGLAYRVETANDPFFVGEFRKQVAFQTAFQLKYEIRASLPFKNNTLAVGSYNYHQDFFGRHLDITLPDGSPIHTGCTAFGLERMAYAFLSQFGLDSKNWPESVREALK
jgi:seryl-tRNA synthetase